QAQPCLFRSGLWSGFCGPGLRFRGKQLLTELSDTAKNGTPRLVWLRGNSAAIITESGNK
ncbi:MAG: hypothetical protein ACRC7Q_15130, partial [Plesiomonas shigelloides]